MPFRSPAAVTLPGALDIARALRPFMRRVPLQGKFILNEEATAERIAEEGLWVPILDPALRRWLEIALVVDDGAAMRVWRQTIAELQLLLGRHGAFHIVRIWRLVTDANDGIVRLYAEHGQNESPQYARNPLELIDPSGQRLILVVTDCVSPALHGGAVSQVLTSWGRSNPVTIVQVLPQRLWVRTGLREATPVRLHVPAPPRDLPLRGKPMQASPQAAPQASRMSPGCTSRLRQTDARVPLLARSFLAGLRHLLHRQVEPPGPSGLPALLVRARRHRGQETLTHGRNAGSYTAGRPFALHLPKPTTSHPVLGGSQKPRTPGFPGGCDACEE